MVHIMGKEGFQIKGPYAGPMVLILQFEAKQGDHSCRIAVLGSRPSN